MNIKSALFLFLSLLGIAACSWKRDSGNSGLVVNKKDTAVMGMARSITVSQFLDTIKAMNSLLRGNCEAAVRDSVLAIKLIRTANTIMNFSDSGLQELQQVSGYSKEDIEFTALFEQCNCIETLMKWYSHSISLSTHAIYFEGLDIIYTPEVHSIEGNIYRIE